MSLMDGVEPSVVTRLLDAGFRVHAISEGRGIVRPVDDREEILNLLVDDPSALNLYLERPPGGMPEVQEMQSRPIARAVGD